MCYFAAMINLASTLDVLRWHVDVGVDETIGETPIDRFALVEAKPQTPSTVRPKQSQSQSRVSSTSPAVSEQLASDEMAQSAKEIAGQAKDIESLRVALSGFDGCSLKKTATNLVFIDGNPAARLMLVGEAPGAHEDRQGLPFAGPSGELLNKMLASILIEREDVLISNTVFWRPPGNRTPTSQEAAICLPFMERLIELVAPDILVTLGGPASKALLGETQGVGRLRGRWFSYKTPGMEKPIDATALFHPEYLLRTPMQKRAAWQDLLMIKEKLSLLGQ